MNKWIKVSDKLPEPYMFVLVYNSSYRKVRPDYVLPDDTWYFNEGFITHWQPLTLPEPPQENNK